MRCFYHREKEAVGICKSCNRGICGDCASEIPDGIACLDRCESLAMELSALISRNSRFSANTRRGGIEYTAIGIFFIAFGLVFAGLAAFSTAPRFIGGNSAMALLFVAAGLASFIYGRRINRLWAPRSQGDSDAV